jgi:hypothetical protein
MDSGFAGAALLSAPLRAKWGKSEAPRSGKNASRVNGCQAAGGWVGEKSAEGWAGGMLRVVEDQSALIPQEMTSKLGGITCNLARWSQWDQHGRHSRRGEASLEGSLMRAVKGSLGLSHEERKKQKALGGRAEGMYFAHIIHEVLSRNGGVRATRARLDLRDM